MENIIGFIFDISTLNKRNDSKDNKIFARFLKRRINSRKPMSSFDVYLITFLVFIDYKTLVQIS